MEEKTLKDEHFDALKEIANISSGSASCALSDLIKKKVNIKIPKVDLVPKDMLYDKVGGMKNLLVVVFSLVKGDVEGSLLMIFDKKSMLLMMDNLQNKPSGTTKFMREEDQPYIRKLCSVLNNSYIHPLSDFLGLKLEPTEPQIISLQGELLVDYLSLNIAKDVEKVILLSTNFDIDQQSEIKGDFVLLLPIKNMDNLIESINKKSQGII